MYNHYVPDSSGIYRKIEIEEPLYRPKLPNTDSPISLVAKNEKKRGLLPKDLDGGDLLILLILLLLLMDGSEEDNSTILIILACFLLL